MQRIGSKIPVTGAGARVANRAASARGGPPRAALVGVLLLASLAGGCAGVAVVEHHLSQSETEVGLGAGSEPQGRVFSASDERITLTALLAAARGSGGRRLVVEWLFPEGGVYIRRPVRPGRPGGDVVVTTMAVRGQPPSRRPGIWRVRLSLAGETLIEREFEIRDAAPAGSAAQSAAREGCPSRTGPIARGAWAGAAVLRRLGEVYEPAVLLSSPYARCPPIHFQGRVSPGG